jgi:hypothetical protein
MKRLVVLFPIVARIALVVIAIVITSAGRAQTIAGTTASVVWDANDKLIGPLLGTTFPSPTYGFIRLVVSSPIVQSSSVIVAIGRWHESTDGELGWYRDDILYDGDVCNGTAMADEQNFPSITERIGLINWNGVLYLSDAAPKVLPAATRYRSFYGGLDGICHVTSQPQSGHFIALAPFGNLGQFFREPLSIGDQSRRRTVSHDAKTDQ